VTPFNATAERSRRAAVGVLALVVVLALAAIFLVGYLPNRHYSRVLDDMTRPATWRFSGTGTLTFPAEPRMGSMRVLRVAMQMFVDKPAPTRNGLSSVNLRREFGAGEDWSGYNRISMWIRPDVSGFPMLPLQIVLHNDGAEKVPDKYNREGTHYVTLANNRWTHVVWEIEPLARDRVTMLEFGYWVNKMLAAPSDRVAFEIGQLELQRVDADHHTGWNVAPGKISFSHTGYQTGLSKTAVTSDSGASEFQLLRVTNGVAGAVVLRKPLQSVRGRLGEFRQADFSEVNAPGSYALRIGNTEWPKWVEVMMSFLQSVVSGTGPVLVRTLSSIGNRICCCG